MPRKRNPENKGLPLRWRHVNGAYYYQVPPGLESLWDGKQTFRLGKTLPEAYKTWAARIESVNGAKTLGEAFDRYALEVVPTKAPRTQVENLRALTRLRKPFGHFPLDSMQPQYCYQYVDKAAKKGPARKEIKVLSHVFTMAIEWGYIARHPLIGQMKMKGDVPRTRYVEDWELLESLSLVTKRKKGSVGMIQAYIRIKLLTGLRRGDLLRLTMADLKEDGIHVTPHKTRTSTGKKLIIDWSDDVREAVAMAKKARPGLAVPWLFCTGKGRCYIDEETGKASGWDSMWQRFMDRVLKETKLENRFTEHDLRAKCASDAESLGHARALLAHADSRITDRIYRRKPERVKPLR